MLPVLDDSLCDKSVENALVQKCFQLTENRVSDIIGHASD
jgi:hypothetical protein